MEQPKDDPQRVGLARRLVLTVALLLLTVPWWPSLAGRLFGLPAWAVFAISATVVYAGVIAWLLERHWDDGSADEPELDAEQWPP
ncbi:MAG: hypothetical protein AAGE01_02075 [Pseudomonadota bacterium]